METEQRLFNESLFSFIVEISLDQTAVVQSLSRARLFETP